jgi:hypothetical protein
MAAAGSGKKGSGNPLEVSGANKEISKQKDPKDGRGTENLGRGDEGQRRSGHGRPTKWGKV